MARELKCIIFAENMEQEPLINIKKSLLAVNMSLHKHADSMPIATFELIAKALSVYP